MQTLAKFQVEKTAFGSAVRQLLVSHAGVDASAVTEGDNFAVWPRPGSDAFVGISPILSVVGSANNASTSSLLLPSHQSAPEVRASIMQWCNVASQLAASQVSFADVEARANIPPGISTVNFVVGSEVPSVADLLLLSSLKSNMKQCKAEAPNVYKWAERALKKNELCQQFGSLTSAVAAAETQQQEQQQSSTENNNNNIASPTSTTTSTKEGKQEFAIPNAAEIAARRAAKEQAKKEKAEKDALAASAATGANGGADGANAPATSSSTTNKKKDASASSATTTKDSAPLSPDDGLDLRVGKITAVANHPTAERLYVETIDLGEASGPRTIISGLVQHYKPEQLQDQLVIVVTNMKPKKLQGTDSHGMVLCASTADAVKFIQPPAGAKLGDCVAFGKNIAAAVAGKEIPSSTKMSQLLEPLRTDENGIVLWKDIPLTIGSDHQPVTAPLKGVPVK